MKFLVVDDSALARNRIKEHVEALGYEVIAEASNGKEAIECYNKYKPNMVTIDYEMPELNGLEASKRLLTLNKDLSIILITSIEDKKELINAIKIGVKRVIKKPFTQELFNQTIKELE